MPAASTASTLIMALATFQPQGITVTGSQVTVQLPAGAVPLLGVEAITADYCAGVIERTLAPLLSTAKLAGNYPVTPENKSLNAVAVETGCARPNFQQARDRADELRTAASVAQTMQRGHYAPRDRPAADIAAEKAAVAVTERLKQRCGVTDMPASLLTYVPGATLTVRAEPSATSKPLGQVPALAVLAVVTAQSGWICAHAVEASLKDLAGWIPANPDHLVAVGPFNVVLTKVVVQDRTWSLSTKADVLRQRIRVGFTEDQVRVSLGKPTRVISEETAAGVTATWTYPGQAIVFKSGIVSLIRKIE